MNLLSIEDLISFISLSMGLHPKICKALIGQASLSRIAYSKLVSFTSRFEVFFFINLADF